MESQFDSAREAAGRSLVIFPGALGDFICFLPALDALARRGAVDVLARSEYADLVSPPIRVASIERREIAQLFVREADLREVEEFLRPYDRVYSWSGGGDAAFNKNFARATGARGRLFPFRPAALKEHISDYYLGCVGAAAEAPPPEVKIKPEALAWARAWLAARGLGVNGNNRGGVKWNNRTLLVAPGSGAPEKNWPREFFRDIVQWWQWSSSGQVVVVLGPAEDGDHAFWSECAAVARGLSLARLAALISLSDGYLGNDSGVTQLAAAVGATTLALFGPTDPAVWAPRRPRVSVARLGVECSPCAHPVMKSCPHRKCLKTFDPPDIMRLLKEKIP